MVQLPLVVAATHEAQHAEDMQTCYSVLAVQKQPPVDFQEQEEEIEKKMIQPIFQRDIREFALRCLCPSKGTANNILKVHVTILDFWKYNNSSNILLKSVYTCN